MREGRKSSKEDIAEKELSLKLDAIGMHPNYGSTQIGAATSQFPSA